MAYSLISDNHILRRDKMSHDFGERIFSLLKDGYICRTHYHGTSLSFATLKHRTNGKTISLRAYYDTGEIHQFSDGKITFTHQYD